MMNIPWKLKPSIFVVIDYLNAPNVRQWNSRDNNSEWMTIKDLQNWITLNSDG